MNNDNYEDIIDLPHYEPLRHPRMSMESRAAQFAPFAALTGYDDAVRETARTTSERIEIDEGLKIFLNKKLQIILENIDNKPEVTITYFIYDKNKSGGKYETITSNISKINMTEQYIMFTNKIKIDINEIIDIKGNLFNELDY